MSNDVVIVKLELDTKSVDINLNNLEKKTAESFSDEGSKSMTQAIDGLNKAVENLNKSISVTEKSTTALKSNIDGLGRGGSALDAIANGFKNILSIGAVGLAGAGIIPILSGAGVQGAKKAYQDLFSVIGTGFKTIGVFAKGFFDGFVGNIKTGKISQTLGQDFQLVADAAFKGTRSLFGIAEASLVASSKLTALAVAVNLLEGPFDSLLGTTLSLAAAISTIASVVLVGLIFKAAELAKTIGDNLTQAFQKSYNEFLLFRKETIAFTETINAFNSATGGASGTTEEWSAQISVLSQELNFSQRELKKTITELVAVGSRLGLNQEQTEKLLRVTAEYARISGKDLFDTAVAFSSALQGNSQAVLSYGVKLSEASNAQFALKQGIQETFGQLSEADKTQVRFNNLISQYNVVQGIATTLSNDWFQQNKKLEISLDRLNTQVGLGAAYVEDFNLAAGILNKIVNVIPDSVARLTGLFGALGGRLLSIAGLFIELSFKIFLVYKGFVLLDAILKTQTFNAFATRTLPLLNSSLVQTAKNLGSVTANFSGMANAGKTLGEVISAQRGNILKFIFGVSTAGATGASILQLVLQRVGGALTFLLGASKSVLLVIGPLLLKFAAIAAAVALVVKVFQVLEEKTQVFSLLFESVKVAVGSLVGGFGDLSGAITSFANTAKEVLGVGFGAIIFVVAKSFGVLVKIAADVSSVFSQQVSAPLKQASANLDGLSENIKTAGFNFLALGERAIASSKNIKTSFKDYEKLNEIIKELRDTVGTSDLGKIQQEQAQRLQVLTAAFNAEVISLQKFEDNKRLVQLDAQRKTQEALRSALGFQEQTTDQTLVAAFNRRQLIINEAYNRALITQAQYGQLTLQNQQALNQAMDDLVKAQSNATISELDKIKEAYNLTAEQASTAMEIASAIADTKTKLITATFERLGASIIQGGSAFSDFRSVVFNILGDFAIQVGVLVLGIGKAVSALAAALASLNPASAFIAGAALITIGGLLKAMASARPGTTGPVGTAGGSIGPGTPLPGVQPNQDFNPRPDAERDKINPNVVINIEGSLFSTEQTGRTIVDLISKEFDKSGAQIRRRGFV